MLVNDGLNFLLETLRIVLVSGRFGLVLAVRVLALGVGLRELRIAGVMTSVTNGTYFNFLSAIVLHHEAIGLHAESARLLQSMARF